MNEISQLLQQRFGLSAEQAQEAETAILGLVRSKVPPQFQGIFDSLVGQAGGQADPSQSGGLGSLLGAAEGLLGMNK
jgi:hypothetical protein